VKRRRATLALLAASCAAALLLAEAAVRSFFPQPLRPAWDDDLHGLRVARPGLRGRHVQPGAFDVTVTINRQRLRARADYTPEPAAGVTRIAVLGDSMTFGWGAEDAATYPARVEQALRRDRPAVEVLNAGFPGTSAGEKVAWYEEGVRALRPRLVVLTLLGDDVDGDLYWRAFRLERGQAVPTPAAERAVAVRGARSLLGRVPGSGALAAHSQAFGLVRRALTRLVSGERTTALGQRPASEEERRRFREEGLPLLSAEIARLQRVTRDDGARLALVFVPFRQGVYDDAGNPGAPPWWSEELRWKSQAIVEEAARTAAALDLPFLDTTPALAARARTSAPLYHQGAETHPTPAGYQAIAGEVTAFLKARHLVP
jgi:lysophospholipase L1-like esterase